jgi:uncharacterized protein (DUF2249 family)
LGVQGEILIDARGMEPPEPMQLVLEALGLLTAGGRVRLLIHREPLPLYTLLAQDHYRFTTRRLNETDFEVLIEGPASP